MKYAVHLFPTVRVKVIGIEAEDAKEAVEKAEAALNLHEVLDNPSPGEENVEHVEWDESACAIALIDPLNSNGEVLYDQSVWLDAQTYLPLVEGRTHAELRAAAAELCAQFMTEVLDAHESLTGIAEEHGVRTLADLMYLQQAILKSGYIDHYPGESSVLEIIQGLPSSEKWLPFVKVEALPVDETAAERRLLEWHLRCQGLSETDLDDLVHDRLAPENASAVNNEGMGMQLFTLMRTGGEFIYLLQLLERELQGYAYGDFAVRARITCEGVAHVKFDALPWLVNASYDDLRALAASGSPEFRSAGLGLFDKAGEIALWCKDHGKAHLVDERSRLRAFFETVEMRNGQATGKALRTEIDEDDFKRFAAALVAHYGPDAQIL